MYTHSSDCHSDFCALAGGIDDCKGIVEPCPWCSGAFEILPPTLALANAAIIDISELRKLLAEAKHSRAEMNKIGYADVTRAEVDLLHAAVNALPELLDEIERLRPYDIDSSKEAIRKSLIQIQGERNRQLEAAVTQLAALVRCDCDSRLPIRTHEAISNCPHLKAAAIVKALKEKAE